MDLEDLMSELECPIAGLKELLDILIDKCEDSCGFFRNNDEYETFLRLKGLIYFLIAGVRKIEYILSKHREVVEEYYKKKRK